MLKKFIQILGLQALILLVFQLSRAYFVLYGHTDDEALGSGLIFAMSALRGLPLDLATSVYCLAPFFILFLTELLIRKKISSGIYLFFIVFELVIIGMLCISDPELFRQWGSKFNNQVLVYISHPKEMALSAGSTNWARTGIMSIILLLAFIFIGKWMYKLCKFELKVQWNSILMMLLLIPILVITARGGLGVTTISQSSAVYSDNKFYNAAAINSLWNAIYYIVQDTEKLYDENYFTLDSPVRESLFNEQFEGKDSLPDLTNKQKPNIVIVVLESFTAMASKSFGGIHNCTPGLDKIAKEGISFKKCYASGDRTEKGLVSILSGYPAQPQSSIIVFNDKAGNLPFLGEDLAGYSSSFVYGGDANFASMKGYLRSHGVNKIIDSDDFTAEEKNSKWGAHDENVYQKALENMNSESKPFLSVILSLSSHEPFDVPYQSSFLDGSLQGKFENSVNYSDSCLFDFITKCKNEPWYDNTLFVIVADHGHNMGIKEIEFYKKERFHIPLIITGGALKQDFKGVEIDEYISQTIIPKLILQSIDVPANQYFKQCGIDSLSFVQYAFAAGYGRITKNAYTLYDNVSGNWIYEGDKSKEEQEKKRGNIFQQYLIEDFLRK